jgi:hypothetical protein
MATPCALTRNMPANSKPANGRMVRSRPGHSSAPGCRRRNDVRMMAARRRPHGQVWATGRCGRAAVGMVLLPEPLIRTLWPVVGAWRESCGRRRRTLAEINLGLRLGPASGSASGRRVGGDREGFRGRPETMLLRLNDGGAARAAACSSMPVTMNVVATGSAPAPSAVSSPSTGSGPRQAR